jgi:hypothetical protein
MSQTETIDKLFLELSQFTKAITNKEVNLRGKIKQLNGLLANKDTEIERLTGLLTVSKCPDCGGFGSYAVPPSGDCQPCEWCDCVKKLLKGGKDG